MWIVSTSESLDHLLEARDYINLLKQQGNNHENRDPIMQAIHVTLSVLALE